MEKKVICAQLSTVLKTRIKVMLLHFCLDHFTFIFQTLPHLEKVISLLLF